jgi:hypothetical protein
VSTKPGNSLLVSVTGKTDGVKQASESYMQTIQQLYRRKILRHMNGRYTSMITRFRGIRYAVTLVRELMRSVAHLNSVPMRAAVTPPA